MYGKKRVVITKNNMIVLAGGRSWIPVGFIFPQKMLNGTLHAHVLKDEFDRDGGHNEIFAPNKTTLRELVNNQYKLTLGS